MSGIAALVLGVAAQLSACEARVGKSVTLSDHAAVGQAIASIRTREPSETQAAYDSFYRDAIGKIGTTHVFGAMSPETRALPYDPDRRELRVMHDAFDSGRLETAINTGGGSFMIAPVGFGVYLGQARGRVVRQEYVVEASGSAAAARHLIGAEPIAEQLGAIRVKASNADKLRGSLSVAYLVELKPPYLLPHSHMRLSGDVQCAMLIDAVGKVYFVISTN